MYELSIRGLIWFCSYLEFQQPSIFLHQPKLEYFCIGSIELRIHRTDQLDNLLKLRVRHSQKITKSKLNGLEWTGSKWVKVNGVKVDGQNFGFQRDQNEFMKNGRNRAKVDDQLNLSGQSLVKADGQNDEKLTFTFIQKDRPVYPFWSLDRPFWCK